ncbi:PREDICTED: uncharacterized protein LOC109586508 isoform X1 [Amphimedon queenslandica]|uniref:Lipase maturation factor n=1 Tax=Amphimedon queenslandica TaxID=400682 RepID=A0AAN0JMN7_AMPQE|nr:PREDICTED: uncharacterized protein LOC109586508 isoform X1 [Amphimedon queenslandica]|eukprot:XP_019858263.1 PREDICTED: uncharacterized protein LOC109586508 isoform X1 [Amphimedon queenslandica]
MRGDSCWRDLTCMNYHYETQPVPNPFSYYLHQSPEIIHNIETMGNHIVELFFPFLIMLPQPFCAINGIVQILFQIPAEQGQTYASEVNAIFGETSALTARNVEEMFIEITCKLPPDCLTSLPAGASLLRQTDTPCAKGGCCGGGGGDKGPS